MQTKTFSKTKQALNNPNSFQIYAFICIFFFFFYWYQHESWHFPPLFSFCVAGNLLRSGDVRGYQSMARMYTRLAAMPKKGWMISDIVSLCCAWLGNKSSMYTSVHCSVLNLFKSIHFKTWFLLFGDLY